MLRIISKYCFVLYIAMRVSQYYRTYLKTTFFNTYNEYNKLIWTNKSSTEEWESSIINHQQIMRKINKYTSSNRDSKVD